MKSYLTIALAFLLAIPHLSKCQSVDPMTDQMRYDMYKKKRTNGIIILGVGGGLLVGGIAMAANGKWSETRTGTSVNYNARDPLAVVGILSSLAGLPMVIVGAIKTSLANKKVNYYSKFVMSMDSSPFGPTVGLAYRF